MRPFDRSKIPAPKCQKPKLHSGINVIEIGCGVGLHPIRYCQKHPDHQIIAIERTKIKFDKFKGRLENHPDIKNCIALHEDAISVITHLIDLESIDKYFILYPNPYPKKSDQNKRFYAMPFMEEILRTLKKGGEIELATNDFHYRSECMEYFEKVWKLNLSEETHPKYGRTHFEKKYLEQGQTCYNLLFKKI